MTPRHPLPWPVLVSIPHDGHDLPPSILADMLKRGESEADLRRRCHYGGDPYTDSIFHWPEASRVVSTPWSRFVVDVNRSRQASGPNGVIKSVDFDLIPFYPQGFVIPDSEERLRQYWDPYHQAMAETLQAQDIRLLIDGHSMSEVGPQLGPDAGGVRPAICLATEAETSEGIRAACPRGMAEAAFRAAEAEVARLFPAWPADKRVRFNDPFNGGYILEAHSQAHSTALPPGLMIECNRGLYLDEASLLPFPGALEKLRSLTQAIALAALNWLQGEDGVAYPRVSEK